MAIKKSELYSSLWESCDKLRGGMDASQYKDFILVLLFVKYVSDKAASQKASLLEVPAGGGFSDMVALKGDPEIGDKINKIIGKLAQANHLEGVIDVADFNDEDKLGKGKEMVDRLSDLIGIFSNPALDFKGNRAEGDDLLGDAYEYLMRHFATQSGKSKGQFYTPAEVSRIMAKVIGVAEATSGEQAIYDPTCGSGSLLLKAHDEAKSKTGFDLSIYGQEMDNATAALATMNMFLHDCPTAEIWKDNSLARPYFKNPDGTLRRFEFGVANPPFSSKAWSTGFHPLEDQWRRFDFVLSAPGGGQSHVLPPAKNGDYAFLLHLLASLKSKGKGAIILPHGVLFRGNAEAEIRKKLIGQGVIKGIIGLPANLFYGTGIPACIIVLDKENANVRRGLFLIDASTGFLKDGNKNRLREQDIHKIVDTFTRQIETPRYSRMVPLSEIEKNDWNLNIPRYIDASLPEDVQDIAAHLRGGIPDRDVDALEDFWKTLPQVRALLFEPSSQAGYSALRLEPSQIKAAILEHPEFIAFQGKASTLFENWKARHEPRMRGIQIGERPRPIIETLSEDLLETFRVARLLDAYDVYQLLMDYWNETMQDDVYGLVQEGWKAVEGEQPNTDLIPPVFIIARYFQGEHLAINELEAAREGLARRMEELDEEHGGEDGLFAEARNEKGKLSKASVKARIGAIKFDAEAREERALLQEYSRLIEEEAAQAKKVRDAHKALDAKVRAKYATLGEDEIKTLVVGDKWLAALEGAVQGELDRVSQTLTGRVRQLAERYAQPLPELNCEVEEYAARVAAHLARMGFDEQMGLEELASQ